ncbi:MAG: NUDIX hydrolase [Thermoanaerobaculia bacterium]
MFDDAALQRLREHLQHRVSIGIEAPQLRRASVLIPLIRSKGSWAVLFTKRAENLAAHSGQISFPGGTVEEGETFPGAAVREAEEEVGIPAGKVELIGRLDDLVTNSGFLVAPFIGVIHEPIEYVIQASEVDEVFEVPLDALLDPAKPEVRYVLFDTGRHPAYFYRYEQYEVWGLTGRMLKAFLDLVWLAV